MEKKPDSITPQKQIPDIRKQDQSGIKKPMQLDTTLNAELSKEALGEFYYLIASFERELRVFITNKMGSGYEKRLRKDLGYIFDSWDRKRRNDVRMGLEPETDLINYASLGEYIHIVRKYRRMFSENDADLSDIETFIKLLANHGRNPLMHCRVLSLQQFHTSKSAIAFLSQWIKRMK